jgi:hypothetical protein
MSNEDLVGGNRQDVRLRQALAAAPERVGAHVDAISASYSYFNALIGSTRDAWWAGMKPADEPVAHRPVRRADPAPRPYLQQAVTSLVSSLEYMKS